MDRNTLKAGGIPVKEYERVHKWIRYHYGSANKCETCLNTKAKLYQWALKKGCKYEKNVNNFIQLCTSCHRKYDGAGNHKLIPAVSVIQIDKNDNVINNFKSINIASRATGINAASISKCINGKIKKVKGFKWKRNE